MPMKNILQVLNGRLRESRYLKELLRFAKDAENAKRPRSIT